MPAVIIRGDDPAHATRARIICASFCLKAEFWPVMLTACASASSSSAARTAREANQVAARSCWFEFGEGARPT